MVPFGRWAGLLLVAAGAFAAPFWAALPWSLALPALGMIAAAMLVAALAAALQRTGVGSAHRARRALQRVEHAAERRVHIVHQHVARAGIQYRRYLIG